MTQMFTFFVFFLSLSILIIFFLGSKKSKWDLLSTSTFECGFSSYYYSRFSFSVHYYLVGLIFLFLDLELCFFFPFMLMELSMINQVLGSLVFVSILGIGLGYEWFKGQLEWKN